MSRKPSFNDPYAVPRECIHAVPLGRPCAGCAQIEEGRKIRKQLERQLRDTPLGRLCGLK